MATSPKLEYTYMDIGQSGGEVRFNSALNRSETFGQLILENAGQAAPPGSPSNGDTYYVIATASGDWTGKEGDIAFYYDGWYFLTAVEGLIAYIKGESSPVQYYSSGGSWTAV